MSKDDEADTQIYKVLINIEEQYAFWPNFKKEIPYGWRETGKQGTKEECREYVRAAWTDMKPLSLRRQLEKNNQKHTIM